MSADDGPAAPRVSLRSSTAPGPVPGADGPVRERRRRGPKLTAMLLLVAALAALGADDYQRGREGDALLAQVQRSRGVLDLADRRITGISSYVAPSLGSGGPPEATVRLRSIITDTSRDQAPLVLAAADRVDGLTTLPWHGAVRRAADDYADYLRARANLYADPTAAADGPAVERVDRLARQARESLLAVAGAGGREQVERLLPAPS